MRVTILGCGGSGGVPLADGSPGGYWGACDPANPRNRRRRVSVLVEQGDSAILVDTSPDLREQILETPIRHLDAVVFTHGHADHAHGIDELRSLVHRRKAAIPAFTDPQTRSELTARFAYAFASSAEPEALYRPMLEDRLLESPQEIAGIAVTPFRQGHGRETTLGLRFGDLAYSTDVVELDEDAFRALAGVRIWIVDCLRIGPPHPTHAWLKRSLEWIARVGPERAVLTHMNHQTDYATLASRCPPGVEPGYDGMVLEL